MYFRNCNTGNPQGRPFNECSKLWHLPPPKLHMTPFQSYDGCRGPAVMRPYKPAQSHWNVILPLSPFHPTRIFRLLPSGHHAPYLPSETVCVPEPCGGSTCSSHFIMPFVDGTKWWTPEELLHFAALESSAQCCRSFWTHAEKSVWPGGWIGIRPKAREGLVEEGKGLLGPEVQHQTSWGCGRSWEGQGRWA